MTTVTSQEFSHQASHVRDLSDDSPVFITVQGKVSTVVLSIDEYQRLSSGKPSILEAIGTHDAAFIDFELPKRELETDHRTVTFD